MMRTILIVEDSPDLMMNEGRVLEAMGYHVRTCTGGPMFHAACPMLRVKVCPLLNSVDLIIFSLSADLPMRNKTYRGVHLLRAYREHPVYGCLPMLVLSFGAPPIVGGSGPFRVIERLGPSNRVVDEVVRMLGDRVLVEA